MTEKNNIINSLNAISPIDGRYCSKVTELQDVFSEHALFYYRLRVEIQWLKALSTNPKINEVNTLSVDAQNYLDMISNEFSRDDSLHIKNLEATTNHDVKAVEYFLKEKMQGHAELQPLSEFVHFACTSEDINNVAYALMLQDARERIMLPLLQRLTSDLTNMAHQYAEVPMLARTHGQAATPTTVGKELANVVARLQRQITCFAGIEITAKLNGATGNWNAHYFTYPEVDWPMLCKQVIKGLGLHWNPYTTQIEPHDYIAELFHAMTRVNTILIDLARDFWGYISLGYFKQSVKQNEVGSSTMPHKVNPIDFENAEGNLSLANNLLIHLSQRLPISRWQRDLVDSTLLRNMGVAFAHGVIAYRSLSKGLDKCALNEERITEDLAAHSEVLAEAIQTVMRRYGFDAPYEQLKHLTRGKASLTLTDLREFIQTLELAEPVKAKLLALTPGQYLGYASQLAKEI